MLVTHIPRLVLLFSLALPLAAFGRGSGILDLTNLYNYANQEVPDYITLDETPNDNPITDEGATLGRVLFYDKRLSTNNTISCASCHDQTHAFSDINDASLGVNGKTGRHSMRLINLRFRELDNTAVFWDKRAATVEEQATQPIRDHIEMGFSGEDGSLDFDDLIDKLEAIPEYTTLFNSAFGSSEIDEDKIQKALAQFVRSIQSFDSRYDEGRAQVNQARQDFPNFTNDENTGKTLYRTRANNGGANCGVCHSLDNFELDNIQGNNGVVTSLSGDSDFTNARSPNLRDLVDADGIPHGGFMHDASLSTLEDVMAHYNSIPATTNLAPQLGGPGAGQNLGLTETEINQVVAFLKTLTGSNVYTDPKWSDPFDAQGDLTLLTEAFSISNFDVEATDTLSLEWHSTPGKTYTLWTSSDLESWEVLDGNIKAHSSETTTTYSSLDVAGSEHAFYRVSEEATQVEDQNLLFIILDDWGVDASPLYNTATDEVFLANMPNLDTLAASGLRFTRAYVNPSCSPTRASLMTGRFAHQTGVYSPETNSAFSADELTLPEAIANAESEYALALVGKWHLGNSNTAYSTLGGWPEFYGFNGGGVGNYESWEKNSNGTLSDSTTYTTTDQVDEAIAFIGRSETAEQPWFCWLAFNAPHSPFHEPPESLAPAGGYSAQGDGENDNRWFYRKALEAVDTELGRLFSNIDLANTNVIVIGDNGTPGQVVQSPFESGRAKGSIHDGGTNVPFIVSGPAVSASGGSTTDALFHAVDIYPTILDLLGIGPTTVATAEVLGQTQSLLPILQGSDTATRVMVAEGGNAPDSARAIVSSEYPDYKLVIYGDPDDVDDTPTLEFYNTGQPNFDVTERSPLTIDSLTGIELDAYEACIALDAALGGGYNAP